MTLSFANDIMDRIRNQKQMKDRFSLVDERDIRKKIVYERLIVVEVWL